MLPMSKRDKSALVSGGLRQMYEMVGYKLCLRFFTIQISEAKKKKKKVLYKQQESIFHSSEAGKSKIKVLVDSAPQ